MRGRVAWGGSPAPGGVNITRCWGSTTKPHPSSPLTAGRSRGAPTPLPSHPPAARPAASRAPPLSAAPAPAVGLGTLHPPGSSARLQPDRARNAGTQWWEGKQSNQGCKWARLKMTDDSASLLQLQLLPCYSLRHSGLRSRRAAVSSAALHCTTASSSASVWPPAAPPPPPPLLLLLACCCCWSVSIVSPHPSPPRSARYCRSCRRGTAVRRRRHIASHPPTTNTCCQTR